MKNDGDLDNNKDDNYHGNDDYGHIDDHWSYWW